MAAEVLNMNILTINKHRCKLKVLCFKTATKPYTKRYLQAEKKASRTNCTFGFCQRSKPKHKKPKEQFLANANLKVKKLLYI